MKMEGEREEKRWVKGNKERIEKMNGKRHRQNVQIADYWKSTKLGEKYNSRLCFFILRMHAGLTVKCKLTSYSKRINSMNFGVKIVPGSFLTSSLLLIKISKALDKLFPLP